MTGFSFVPELFLLDTHARFGFAESARVKLDFCEDINEVNPYSHLCVHSDVWESKCEYNFNPIDVSNACNYLYPQATGFSFTPFP